VYFTHPAWNETGEVLAPEGRASLEELGFPWPRSEDDIFREELPKPSERREVARNSLPSELGALEDALPAWDYEDGR